jgi:hypothetical protein
MNKSNIQTSSQYVPFYSFGYYHVCPEERVTLPEYGCRDIHVVVRHDCYFHHFTLFLSLLVILPRSSEKIQFIDLQTNNDTIEVNYLQSTGNDADYDQLLGQAEHGSIPLQSSILCNPWFLKEVVARLQRNEDEVSSDEESFVSITEVSYADPNTTEIYKAHKPDSDPLEPRVTRSKSKSLNIDDLSKARR